MAVWSSFSRAFSGSKQLSNFILSRVVPKNVSQTVRPMSGHDRFVIQPTRWQWHKTKDLIHFYLFVGALPLGLLSLYANIFVGPAELAPIPEGYEPKEWEYYRHPITRFFKRYIMESEQEAYERHLHYCWEVCDKAQFRKIEKEVKAMQESRGDYQHWYYIPVETKSYERIQQDVYEMENERTKGR